jgi:phosphopantetheine adenylyltransferase
MKTINLNSSMISKDIDVVFFRCDEEFAHISSSTIRNLQSFRPGSGDKYLI